MSQKRARKNRAAARKAAAAVFACSMVLSNVSMLPITAQETGEQVQQAETVIDGFETVSANVSDYTKNSNTSYRMHKNGGNNRLVSDISAKSFSYEAKVKIEEGDRGSLIFGTAKQNYDDFGNFFGLELSAKDGNFYIKLFQDGGAGGELVHSTEVLSGVDTSAEVALKLSVDEDKNIEVYINGQKVDIEVNDDFKYHYTGGYLGLLTWQSKVAFSDIKVTRYTDSTPDFKSNLQNLKGIKGYWKDTDEGLYSNGGGDNFAMSTTEGTDFSYSTDVRLRKDGAAALVFRSNDDGSESYVANISRKDKNVRLFKFPGGIDVGTGTVALPGEDKETYNLRVEAVGNSIRYYVDDQLLVAGNDDSHTSGKFGLLTFNTTAVYQNLNQKELTADTYPKLSGLDIIGDGTILTPSFKEDAAAYDLFIPRSADSVKLKAGGNADSMSMIIKDAKGNVLQDATAVENNVETASLKLPSGTSRIYLTLKKGDISVETVIKVNKMFSAAELSQEAYRPQFHFSPETNFMNDPNGLVYDPSNQTWHMFFQKQPGVGWVNNQAWGHAQSKDLVTWQEMPLAIPIDDLGYIFSGSAVVDEENTTGFFSDNKEGESKLVAIFTHHGHGTQVQSIAYSKDHGLTWTKYDGNPVIENPGGNPYSTEFRDPKVFRYDNKWYLVAAGGRGRLFASEDLKTWTHVQDFTYANGNELHSECPDLFPLPVDGTGEQKWIYTGGGEFYVQGKFEKQDDGYFHFLAETGAIEEPNGRTNMYATQSYYNDWKGKDRKMLISWLQDYSAPDAIPEKGWNGIQSLPLEVGLKTVNDKVILTHYPAEEINNLHGAVLYEASNKTIEEGGANLLGDVSGRIYDLQAEFTLGTAKEFGFNLRTGDGQKIVFKYNKDTKKMILDKTSSGAAYNNVVDWELLPSADNKVKLRILVDEGVVEAFGNDGEANISDLCFPSAESVGMELFANGGNVHLDQLKIYDMKSMYTGASLSEGIQKVLSLTTPAQAEVGDTFQIQANIYPSEAADTITWVLADGLQKVSEDGNVITVKADKTGTYEVRAKTKSGLEKAAKIKVIKTVFDTNISGWKATSGTWAKSELGLHGNNAGIGDSFNISNAQLKKDIAFTYEADVHFASGTATGLTFGVGDQNNPAGKWLCVNIEKGDKNVAKMFKNTGREDWAVEHKLTDEEKNAKDYHFKVVYDGKGRLEYYLNDNLVAEKDDASFEGGYVGVNTFHADASFNNVVLTTDAPVKTIITKFEDLSFDKGTSLKDVKAKLPKIVTVEKEDGIQVTMPVAWDTDKVDMNKAGTYAVTGKLEGTELKPVIKVTVKDRVLKSLEPGSLSITAQQGSKADTVFKELKKDVTGIYSDGSRENLKVTGWDADKVDFTKPGTYKTVGYLNNSKTDTIEITVTVLKMDTPITDRKIQNKDETISVSGKLPEGITLHTEYLKASDVAKTLKDTSFLNKYALEQGIDFTFMKDGKQYVPTDMLNVCIQVKPEWKDKKLSVIYIDDNGTITKLPCTIKDNLITFETTHFSLYAVVSEKSNEGTTPEIPGSTETPKPGGQTPDAGQSDKTNGTTTSTDQREVPTGDTTNIPALLTMLGAGGLGIFLKMKKDRTDKKKGL